MVILLFYRVFADLISEIVNICNISLLNCFKTKKILLIAIHHNTELKLAVFVYEQIKLLNQLENLK